MLLHCVCVLPSTLHRELYVCRAFPEMGSEELRQNVFSSILMSTKLKSSQASLTYPCCSFCGGGGSSNSRGSPKRKSLLCQLSLYVNPSESFIVWGKKQDEPKGMVWLRSCCVRRGQEEGAVELISRCCRGRCSYTIKLSTAPVADDWYRSLRGESRRAPTVGDDDPTDEEDDRMSATLDAILTEMAPSSSERVEVEDGERDATDAVNGGLNLPPPAVLVTPAPSKKTKKKHSKKLKHSPVLCNPLQGLVTRKTSCPMSVTYSASIYPLDMTTEPNTPTLPELEMTRWSWPQTL